IYICGGVRTRSHTATCGPTPKTMEVVGQLSASVLVSIPPP
ncbi:unnamed protein product, partial [Ectocarpus sp. 8 AP-2014]